MIELGVVMFQALPDHAQRVIFHPERHNSRMDHRPSVRFFLVESHTCHKVPGTVKMGCFAPQSWKHNSGKSRILAYIMAALHTEVSIRVSPFSETVLHSSVVRAQVEEEGVFAVVSFSSVAES